MIKKGIRFKNIDPPIILQELAEDEAVNLPWERFIANDYEEWPFYLKFRFPFLKYFIPLLCIALSYGLVSYNRVISAFCITFLSLFLFLFYLSKKSFKKLEFKVFLKREKIFEEEWIELILKIKNKGYFAIDSMLLQLYFEGIAEKTILKPLGFIGAKNVQSFQVLLKPNLGIGEFKLSPIQLYSRDIFDLFPVCWRKEFEKKITVLPKYLPLPEFRLNQGGSLLHSGAFEVRLPGDSVSFRGLRPYQKGDRLSRIEWKKSQKYQQLLVKEFERLSAIDCAVFIDQNLTGHCEYSKISSLSTMRKIAIEVIQSLLFQQTRLQFFCQDHYIKPGIGKSHELLLEETIVKLDFTNYSHYFPMVLNNLSQVPPYSVVILIFNSFSLDKKEFLRTLIELQKKQVEVIALILDCVQFEKKIKLLIEKDKEVKIEPFFLTLLELEQSSDNELKSKIRNFCSRSYIIGPEESFYKIYNRGF